MGFIGKTKVNTANGYRKIHDLKIGDLVLTHKNRYQKIQNIEVVENQPITEIRTLSEKSFYATDSQDFLFSNVEETHYTDTENQQAFYLKEKNDYLVGFEHIAKFGELGCAFYIYDAITSIVHTDMFETVYNLKVEEDNTFVVDDRVVGGI